VIPARRFHPQPISVESNKSESRTGAINRFLRIRPEKQPLTQSIVT
jgi:hypothetical protein